MKAYLIPLLITVLVILTGYAGYAYFSKSPKPIPVQTTQEFGLIPNNFANK